MPLLISNAPSGGAHANTRLRIDYTAGNGSITINSITAARTDAWASTCNYREGWITCSIGGTQIFNLPLHNTTFPANSGWSSNIQWRSPNTNGANGVGGTVSGSRSSISGNQAVSITISDTRTANINGTWGFSNINAGSSVTQIAFTQHQLGTVNRTQAFINWNTNITPTNIEIESIDNVPVGWTNHGNPGTGRSHSRNGLTPGTAYRIRARVHGNTGGSTNAVGGYINITTRANITAGISANSINRTQITVNWSSSRTANHVNISTDNGATWHAGINVNGTSGTVTASGLTPGTAYNVRVRVQCALESGHFGISGTLPQTTRANIAITSHTQSATTLTSVTITWIANRNVNLVQYRINDGAWETVAGNPNSNTSSYTLGGLAPGTSRNIRTRVQCALEGGHWSPETANLSATTHAIGTMSASPNFNLGDLTSPTGLGTSIASVTTVTPSTVNTTYNLELRVGTNLILNRVGIGNAGAKTITFSRAEQDALYQRMLNNANTAVTWRLITVFGTLSWNSERTATAIITGNQPTIRRKISGQWRRGFVWIKRNGQWRRALAWGKINNIFRRSL
jgi:hypothetical protein